MEARETGIDGVLELLPTRHGDERGWFCEVWNENTLAEVGVTIQWVQDNEALSVARGTLRGLHFQADPHAQDKLVRATRGRLLDVAVDLRSSSATFGQHVAIELSEELGNQLLIPRGFAHGYCTLEPNTVIGYKVSSFYAPQCDRTLRWDAPELDIDWPVDVADAVLSDKDRAAPRLSEIQSSLFD